MITRAGAQRMTEAHPELFARLDDLHAIGIPGAAMVFDPMIDQATGRYLSDIEAFRRRWEMVSESLSG